MSYQIICLKNRAFWNKIIIFIALFVAFVYVVSIFMPAPQAEIQNDGALYQEISQEDNQTAQNEG
ncbi:MAG: hypothetical protein IJU58_00435 [Clostridia bacterium]|nr:hypothetical protein [Clostridia bacterium]